MPPNGLLATVPPETNRSKRSSRSRTSKRRFESSLRRINVLGSVVLEIVPNGDLLLELIATTTSDKCLLFLVSSEALRSSSAYFRVLLDAQKFSEGIDLSSQRAGLLEHFGNAESIPIEKLPKITLEDALPVHHLTESVVEVLLCCLHDLNVPRGQLDTSFLALLAAIADRFDSLASIRECMWWQDWMVRPFVWDGKYRPLELEEELLVRQQILIGLLFGLDRLLHQQSANLIVGGSVRWKDEVSEPVDTSLIWWDLPRGIEEELVARREYVLNTISSLQKHMIDLYIFEPNQCRFGYDSSLACNYYQLGQTVRFFRRTRTLRFESMLQSSEESTLCHRNILEIIATLKACPEYQIDSNHKHCGIRNKFMEALRSIVPEHQVGICGRCWGNDATKESWGDSPECGEWKYRFPFHSQPSQSSNRPDGCSVHRNAKTMYTAKSRDWTRAMAASISRPPEA